MDIRDSRFAVFVEPIPLAGCWIWTGRTHLRDNGYGRFGHAGVAHRASWYISFGKIPKGMHVLHSCDLPCCVNPAHLFLGTQAENNKDRDDKGRHVALLGVQHGMAKLSNNEVLAIRAKYAAGGSSQRALAQEFGMSQAMIYYIVNKHNWKHV